MAGALEETLMCFAESQNCCGWKSHFPCGQALVCTGVWISHPEVLHGMLPVLSTRAGTDHIFLVELDRCLDQNFSNIYRILTKTKCLSILPSHRSDQALSNHRGFFVDFITCSNFWKTRWKERRIILLPLCSPLVHFPAVSHTLSPGYCWMKTSVDLQHSCL